MFDDHEVKEMAVPLILPEEAVAGAAAPPETNLCQETHAQALFTSQSTGEQKPAHVPLLESGSPSAHLPGLSSVLSASQD